VTYIIQYGLETKGQDLQL